MAEIVKVYRQAVGPMRFIGKKYGDADRVDGGFGKQWGDWWENGWFAPLEALITPAMQAQYEDTDAMLGMMRWRDGEPFEYWIGMFVPEGSPIPEGYGSVDFPAATLGICWLQGPENSLFMNEDKCAHRLEQEQYQIVTDEKGAYWFFERYGCPRFTTPDDAGNVILDIGHYIK